MNNIEHLIATEVMGWELSLDYWMVDNVIQVYKDDWQPATSIEDAWKIVKRMAEQGWEFSAESEELTGRAIFISAETSKEFSSKWSWLIEMPNLICLVALKAVGHE